MKKFMYSSPYTQITSSITNEGEAYSYHHCHDRFEILYVISGKGKMIVEGAEHPILPKSLIVIPPLQYHHAVLFDSEPYERFVVHFSRLSIGQDALPFMEQFDNSENSFANYYSERALPNAVIGAFERIELSNALPEAERDIYVKLILGEIIVLLSVASKELLPSDEAELGVRVIKYLNEHLTSDVSLDRLAKRFFVSKYYLCRAFKKHNGISVHGYINQKRVMLAKQMIESGESASGAAYKVGFGDYSAFYRAYMKIVGRPPTMARRGGEYQ